MDKLPNILYRECIDIEATASYWLESFKKDENIATDELIILMYCAAGAKPFTRVSVKDLCPTELFILKSSIDENFEQLQSQVAFNTFSNLIHSILLRNSVQILSNKRFMNIIQTTLQFFAEADRTSYRLVSAVVGIKFMNFALLIDENRIDELNVLKKSFKKLGRKTKFDKVVSDENGEIVRNFPEIKLKMLQRMKVLQKYHFCFKIIFLRLLSSVFEEALRSYESEVRRHCHIAMGSWINFLKLDYVGNSYFSVLVKLMNDPEDELREMALKNYLKCLQNDIGLSLDTKDLAKIFKALLKLVHDQKNEIKIYALKCLNIIDRCKMLSANKVEKILLLIFHEQREVSSQAGFFLHRRISSDAEMTSEKYIREVVYFSQECAENCPEEFLVDSLINKSLFLTDWSAWMKLLIKKDFSKNDEIEVEQLVSLLSCTLKLANTGIVPFGRNSKKRKAMTATSRNIVISSRSFIRNIGKLWTKYGSNDRIFHKFLKCFRYLLFGKVDEEFIFHFTENFQSVLKESKDLAICNECGVGFAMFCRNSIIKRNYRSSKWKMIEDEIDEFSNILEHLCNKLIKKITRKSIEVHLKQSIEIAALHSLQDIAESICWNTLFVDASEMISSEIRRDHKIARLFLIVCFMSLMWISIIFTSKNFPTGLEMIYLQLLEKASGEFFSKLHETSNGSNVLLKITALKIIHWLKKLSHFIKENDGICFLMYTNHF